MKKDISKEQQILDDFNASIGRSGMDYVMPMGQLRVTIYRADGSVEESLHKNIVTKDGLNMIAANMLGSGTGANSAARYIIIGTATAAGSLGSVQGGIGEVDRKLGAVIASSNEVGVWVATWAGNTDSLTGVALGTAGLGNHASSGQGTFFSHVPSLDCTLQASDFLSVQYEVQIGSHAL